MNFQLELKIMKGPHEDLHGYLAAVDELRTNVEFFTCNDNFKSNGLALNHAHDLLAKALMRLEEEFTRLLNTQRCFGICLCNLLYLFTSRNGLEDISHVCCGPL